MLGFSLICIILLILIISKLNEIKRLLKIRNQAKDMNKQIEEMRQQIDSMRNEIGSMVDTFNFKDKTQRRSGNDYRTKSNEINDREHEDEELDTISRSRERRKKRE